MERSGKSKKSNGKSSSRRRQDKNRDSRDHSPEVRRTTKSKSTKKHSEESEEDTGKPTRGQGHSSKRRPSPSPVLVTTEESTSTVVETESSDSGSIPPVLLRKSGSEATPAKPPPEALVDADSINEKMRPKPGEIVPKNVFEVASPRLIPANYLEQGLQATATRERRVRVLLEERKWQKEAWDDLSIELFIQQISAMDSNNYVTKVGVGEREARIYSPIVSRRHYGFCHGIGRSGDLGEPQPKAIGSSIMSSLVNSLVLDVCKTLVSSKVAGAFLCPMATGMSLTLVLLTLKREKPKAKFVVWSRIDQKSCFKCIISAGLEPLIIEGKIEGNFGEVQSNLGEMESVVKVYGADNILCFLTTTSCFAPRVSDSLEPVSKLCQTHNIFHIVNNAYGLQNTTCTHQILEGAEAGRLDIFVQSTDKNLMVPVGGAIIAGFNKDLVQKVRQTYPGRASSSQALDVLITLLSMGSVGYNNLVLHAKENFVHLRQSLETLALSLQERVLPTPHNRISIAMTLNNIAPRLEPVSERCKVITQIGSMLFRRHVGGCRVVTGLETKTIEGHQFRGWGAHCSSFPMPYLTAASTVGMERKDVDWFIKKLEECYEKLATTFANNRVLDYKINTVEVED